MFEFTSQPCKANQFLLGKKKKKKEHVIIYRRKIYTNNNLFTNKNKY